MKTIKAILMAIAAMAVLPAAPALSQADDIWAHTINNETNGVWTVQPERPRARNVSAPDYLGGGALRVHGREGANPWVVQARSPIAGAINQGDVIMVMIYARAEQPAPGGSTLPILVQFSGAPYTTLMSFNQAVDGEWKQYCANAVASASVAGDLGIVAVHLGTAEQLIDLGPVFVFNFGPNYDRARLPTCQ